MTRQDLEAVMDCYAEDAINFQVAAGKSAVGKEQICRDTAGFFKGFPDSYSMVENIIADEDRAAWEWHGGGAFSGEFYGTAPTGKFYELRVLRLSAI